MSELSDQILIDNPRRSKISRYRPYWFVVVPLAAILFQVNVRNLFSHLAYLELPLLVTVYFSLMRREPMSCTLIGAAIGLVQDSMADHLIGVFGIVKTLVGYFAASVSLRFDVENTAIRFILSFFFFFFHQFFTWVLSRALLGQNTTFDLAQTLLFGTFNAMVAVPLFLILDKLKERS